MNYLIARFKGMKDGEYGKLISSDDEFYQLTIEESISYSPDTLLEDNQWFKVESFSTSSYCIFLLKNPWNSTKYTQLRSVDTNKLVYLCAYQSENVYFFQRVFKKSILEGKKSISWGDYIRLDNKEDRLVLEEIPDAVYFCDEDCLYFRKLETIAPIFKGIDELYREATEEEVDSFLSNVFIKLEEGFTSKKVGKANRRRIAMALNTLKDMDTEQRSKLFSYTAKYYPDLKYDQSTFNIGSEQDLKSFLYGIEQRMYTTEVTKEKRAANSFIII